MKEFESKFRVHPPFVVPELAGGGSPVATVSEPEEQRLEAHYVDTGDLRLARLGVTLRYRTGEGADGWDLKVPLGARDEGVRDEIHVPGSPNEAPAELLRLVSAYVRGQNVCPVASLVTNRSRRRLLGEDGQVLAELADDTVEVLDGDTVTARFREIEVEDKGGGADVLDAVGKRLRAAGAIRGRFEPKLVRALGPLAAAPPDPPLPATSFPGKSTVRDVATAYLRMHVRSLLDADVAIRLGGPDAVHDARVAARRLRSTLGTFGDVLVPETAAQLATDLRWFAGELGGQRDKAVLLDRLRTAADDLPAQDAASAHAYLDAWADETSEQPPTSVLDDPRYVDLQGRLVDLAVTPPFTGPADDPALKQLPVILRPMLQKFRSRMSDAVKPGAPAEQAHSARIAGKRLRYAAEATIPLYGKSARRYVEALVVLMEELGTHHDAVVALESLRMRALAEGTTPADAFALGVLAASEREAIDRQTVRVRKAWAKQRDRLKLARLTDG
jgi:CHAD domain-containing protein